MGHGGHCMQLGIWTAEKVSIFQLPETADMLVKAFLFSSPLQLIG